MKKSDFKNRMVVETRDGERYIVVDDFLVGDTGYITLDDFNDDLTNKYFNKLDILRVYISIATLADISNQNLKLLWKRYERWKPGKRDKYYIVEFANEELFAEQYWTNAYYDNELYNKGLIFKTKEEAIEAANKMLNALKEED